MAQKILTLFEDDLDGSEAEGTVLFSIDGAEYEIDLNTDHAETMRGVFAPYIEVARKVSYGRPRRGRAAVSRKTTVKQNGGPNHTEVREWAKAQGLDVKDRGRIPAELIERYQNRDKQEGNGKPPEVTPPTPPELSPEFKTAEPEEKPARKRTPRKPAAK